MIYALRNAVSETLDSSLEVIIAGAALLAAHQRFVMRDDTSYFSLSLSISEKNPCPPSDQSRFINTLPVKWWIIWLSAAQRTRVIHSES